MKTIMKSVHFLSIVLTISLLAGFLSSCTDQCEQTITYRSQRQVTLSLYELRQSVKSQASQSLEHPGKIYVKDNYLFINEIKKGIHIIDNTDPSSPKPISFLAVPGNIDLAVKGNILYADSYTDVVAFDISTPTAVKEVKRVTDVFQNGVIDGLWWTYNASTQAITDNQWDLVTETRQADCDGPNGGNTSVMFDRVFLAQAALGSNAGGGGGTGTGGSMARFTITGNYLYTVSNQDLQLFDVATPTNPQKGKKINLGWGIETIFPYKDKLFIGSTSGMHIYDNSTPSSPKWLSTFQHVMSCDPVVVQDDIAYVTLRSGTMCNRGSNQLDVINISNASAPFLMKSYPMQNPHGLGIDYPTLFLCEGKYGLKTFDVKDALSIDKNQLSHFDNIDAYDVIPLKGTLMMIGKDGLYQYDYSKAKSLKLLSVIPVVNKGL
jgi:hypothetical protein